MPDIRYVKPVATDAGSLTDELRRWTASTTELTMAVVADRSDNLEYQVYETVVAPGVVAAVAAAEREVCDAAIVGCFYDTGLDAAREVASMPVVGPCESALHISALLDTHR